MCEAENCLEKVSTRCNDRESCSVRANDKVFGYACKYNHEYLEVGYRCDTITTLTPTATTATTTTTTSTSTTTTNTFYPATTTANTAPTTTTKPNTTTETCPGEIHVQDIVLERGKL